MFLLDMLFDLFLPYNNILLDKHYMLPILMFFLYIRFLLFRLDILYKQMLRHLNMIRLHMLYIRLLLSVLFLNLQFQLHT